MNDIYNLPIHNGDIVLFPRSATTLMAGVVVEVTDSSVKVMYPWLSRRYNIQNAAYEVKQVFRTVRLNSRGILLIQPPHDINLKYDAWYINAQMPQFEKTILNLILEKREKVLAAEANVKSKKANQDTVS